MQAVDLQDKLCLRRIWGRWVSGTRLLFSARHQPPTRLSALGACGEGVFTGGRLSLQRFSACTSVYTHGPTCAHTQMHRHTEAASLARPLLSQQPLPAMY